MIRFCDYENDFVIPESGVSFHYFNSNFKDLHTHNYWEVFLIQTGSLDHFINDETMSITAQDMFIIRPNDVHCFYQIDDIQSQHINFMITQDSLKALLDPISPNLYPFLLQYPQKIFLRLNNREYRDFMDIINKLYLDTSPLSETVIIKMFILEAVRLAYFRYYKGAAALTASAQSHNANVPKWLVDLLDRMNSVEYIALPLSKICADIPYSQVQINRLFKKHMNMTIGAYFNKMKLKYACNLLKTSNFTVLEISSRIGYNSLSHFNRIFKKNVGCTPKAYRRRAGNKKSR